MKHSQKLLQTATPPACARSAAVATVLDQGQGWYCSTQELRWLLTATTPTPVISDANGTCDATNRNARRLALLALPSWKENKHDIDSSHHQAASSQKAVSIP